MPSMADTVARPLAPPPRAAGSRRGFFAFVKDGVLVTTRNRGLFLPLAALHAARSLATLAARTVGIRYLGPTLGLEVNGDDGLPLSALLDGRSGWFLLPAVAYLVADDVANVVLGFAIQVATACAAVASCSAASIEGGPGRTTTLTLASLLAKVRRNLHGSMATAVFARVVGWASVVAWILVLFAVLAGAAAYVDPILGELVYLPLRLIATPLVFIYYSVPCEVALVVSVAEPGLHAADVLRRARRLTRGGRKAAQALLHAVLSWALNRAVWKMYAVAMARLPPSIATATYFRLDAVVVYMLVAAVEVLYMATVTAYYFDCKRTEEEKAGHVHVE